MGLTHAIEDPSSSIHQFLKQYYDLDAIRKRLTSTKTFIPGRVGSRLESMAFLYWLRWRYQPFWEADTFCWIGAKQLDQQERYRKLIWAGNFSAQRRMECAVELALYEDYARTGRESAMTQAQIERIASRMPRTEALGDYLYRFQHAPTF